MTDELVFPVGHDLGAFHPGRGRPVARYEIRAGRTTYGLPTGDEYRVWLVAHGVPGQPLTWPRYRADLRASGVPDAAGIAGRLAADGLLWRVPPSGDAAVGFAARHRVMPLMTAVGMAEETPPEGYSLGLPGHPTVHVDSLGYWLWLWGGQWDSLWHASAALAGTRLGAAVGDGDPRACLAAVLAELPQLISSGTACLDAAAGAVTPAG